MLNRGEFEVPILIPSREATDPETHDIEIDPPNCVITHDFVAPVFNQQAIKMRYAPIIYSFLSAAIIVSAKIEQQRLLVDDTNNLGPAMPPPQEDSPSTSAPADSDTVILSDVIGRDRSINIFAGFTRDFATVTQRFEDSALNTTILAPINSAIMALPRKPWEDPEDYDNLKTEAYKGEKGEERAQSNLRRFVEAHVVPASPWKEGDKLKTLAGGEIWWESKDGVKRIMPGDIEVSSITSKVYNGEVWILKGVRNYA